MSKIDALIDNKLIQNIFIWILFFLIFTITIQADNRIVSGLFVVLIFAPPVYVQNLLILPHLSKKPISTSFLLILNAVVFTFICSYFLAIFINDGKYEAFMFFNLLGGLMLALIFGATLKMARDSYSRRQKRKEAELKLLKAQLNPHFLFNTLNNLYGLSVIKSDKLPPLMLQLSNLLRYSLYETKAEFVPLEKEITYLKDYIALENIRLEDSKITLNTDTQYADLAIAPMLFIVFVENAFKHLGGIQPAVSISISADENHITFNCQNTVDPIAPAETNLEKGNSGIGLENAKKRLKLLYPDRHQLSISKNEQLFSVHLTLFT